MKQHFSQLRQWATVDKTTRQYLAETKIKHHVFTFDKDIVQIAHGTAMGSILTATVKQPAFNSYKRVVKDTWTYEFSEGDDEWMTLMIICNDQPVGQPIRCAFDYRDQFGLVLVKQATHHEEGEFDIYPLPGPGLRELIDIAYTVYERLPSGNIESILKEIRWPTHKDNLPILSELVKMFAENQQKTELLTSKVVDNETIRNWFMPFYLNKVAKVPRYQEDGTVAFDYVKVFISPRVTPQSVDITVEVAKVEGDVHAPYPTDCYSDTTYTVVGTLQCTSRYIHYHVGENAPNHVFTLLHGFKQSAEKQTRYLGTASTLGISHSSYIKLIQSFYHSFNHVYEMCRREEEVLMKEHEVASDECF